MSDIKTLTITHTDDTTENVDMGFLSRIIPNPDDEDEIKLRFDLINISNEQLKLIISTLIEFAIQSDIFSDDTNSIEGIL